MRFINIIFIFCLLIPGTSFADLTELRDIIRDPVISRRCKAMLKDRSEKIKTQQKLNSLIMRNQKLRYRVKESQKTVTQRLDLNKIQLQNQLRLTKLRISSMEENIVRKGCPGITL